MNTLEDLESINAQQVKDFKLKLRDQFNATKEPWLLNGIYDYFLNTNSLRAVEVLVMVTEPHDKHYFDRALDGVRGTNKLQHLTLLGYVVRKKPLWLYQIFDHPLILELFRILKIDTDIVTVVSALLILNILIPSIPGMVGPHLKDIFEVFSKLAAMNANSNNYQDVQLVHLQISLYTLFHRLYGMFPCNFITFLRKQYSNGDSTPVFFHTVKPMLDTVRVNPLLITASEDWEIEMKRWKNVESHDIIVNCAKLLTNGGSSREYPQNNIYEARSVFNCENLLEAVKVTDNQTISGYCKQLSKSTPDATLWSPSVRHTESIPTMIPVTPITRAFEVSSPYSEQEGSSPPEAAIEATPETTPSQECIKASLPLLSTANRPLSFTTESAVHGIKVPMTDRSFPNSPIKKEVSPFRYSAPEIVIPPLQPSRKVNLMLTDRNQASNESSIIELKPIGVQMRNDLISNERTHSVISTINASSFVDETNGSRPTDVTIAEAVEDFDPCEQEKSGSPCSSGGLHMPDNKSLCDFALHMKRMRSRHYSQCNSDSERFSPGHGPQDGTNFLTDSKVRRTNSCPEIKKSSPNSTSTLSSGSPSKEVLEEKDEDGMDKYDIKKGSFRRKLNRFDKKERGTQTNDTAPSGFPYEHLFLDVFPPLQPAKSTDQTSPTESENSLEETCPSVCEKAQSPSKLLQKYIDAAVQCHNDRRESSIRTTTISLTAENKYLTNQLRLIGAQLQFEEYKREIHAERNRRLLGRSRRNKTLEEYNNALSNQVYMLQKEIEHCNEEVGKIVTEKVTQIEKKQKAATYWREQFVNLQQEHKMVANRCQKVEAHLKEEKDSNEQNQKSLHESRAALSDITNDLRSLQKEALEAKHLRNTVAELQAEILQAGELIINYRNQLIEGSLPTDDVAQLEYFQQAYLIEVERLKQIINTQQLSLDAYKELIATLKQGLEEKENHVNSFAEKLREANEIQQKEIKELQKRLDDVKALYDSEVTRTSDLSEKLNRAKHVTKFSNAKPPRNIDYAAKLNAAFDLDEGARPAQNVVKSPKRSYFAHTDKQQVEISKMVCPEDSIRVEECVKMVTDSTVKCDKVKVSGPIEVLREPDTTETTEVFRSIVKKKGRMECAETGQLRSISISYFDPEPSSSKNE